MTLPAPDLSLIPNEPGCYQYKDKTGTIIYVGKAKNLKHRVSSYFNRTIHDRKTQALVKSIESVDFIVTNSETEAFLLENNLIKRLQPKYNIDLKDSKSYAYIRISDEKYPLISVARNKKTDGEYFGPFVSAKERDYVLYVIKKTFLLRSCRRLPKRPCLRAHLGTCSAPCIGRISEEEYGRLIKSAEGVLNGRTKEIIKFIEEEMTEHSKNLEFEKAMLCRDRIEALKHLSDRQHIDRKKITEEDVINYVLRDGRIYLMLFSVQQGCLAEKQEFVFDSGDEPDERIEEFLTQYYSENEPPLEIILPSMPSEALLEYISQQKERKVTAVVPQKGDKKILLDLVAHNINTIFFGGEIKTAELKKRLHLPETPDVIECFDISHFSGTAMVGSMVQFRYGKPDKSNYRRFRIKTVNQIDDFASIAEVVTRRYTRLKEEGTPYPDLIIIDGGKGQLSYAVKALESIDVKIPIISIAEREEEIYLPGLSSPLPMKRSDKASLFIQEIRDEAHRFAITYSRLLHSKDTLRYNMRNDAACIAEDESEYSAYDDITADADMNTTGDDGAEYDD